MMNSNLANSTYSQVSISSIIVIGRWLYLRSVRIRNRIQMNKLFTNITHELLTPLSILSASVEHLSMVRPEEQAGI